MYLIIYVCIMCSFMYAWMYYMHMHNTYVCMCVYMEETFKHIV